MAAGWSRIRVFSPLGIQLDELDYPTVRSWVLNNGQTSQVGRCQFTVNVYDPLGGINPKLTLANFQYGNLLFIEHKPSVNSDGTSNGLLPDWVGVIVPPQSWEYGKVTITAFSAEQILSFRPVGGISASLPLENTAGRDFVALLNSANNFVRVFGPGIAIQPGSVDQGGNPGVSFAKLDALTEIQGVAARSNYDWDVTGQVGSNGQLQLFGNFYPQKGISSGLVLSNINLQSVAPLYTEQGMAYNTVLGYSSATSAGNRVYAISQNAAAVALQGMICPQPIVFQNTEGVAQPALQALTDAYLAKIAQPQRTFAPTLLDRDNDFSFAVTGNTFLIQNDTVGFQNGGIGIQGAARVTAVEYNELTNLAKLAVTLQ